MARKWSSPELTISTNLKVKGSSGEQAFINGDTSFNMYTYLFPHVDKLVYLHLDTNWSKGYWIYADAKKNEQEENYRRYFDVNGPINSILIAHLEELRLELEYDFSTNSNMENGERLFNLFQKFVEKLRG